MRLTSVNDSVHCTYCLNIHPGESWAENLTAIREYACAIRSELGVTAPFGLGLRLSATAAQTLAQDSELSAFRRFLDSQNLYVFTVNAFPYGQFHGCRVKEQVYAPDWSAAERLQYTILVADILARLLPEGVPGSISTVPGSYRQWSADPARQAQILLNLGLFARHCRELRQRTGADIRLALEPEPDCLWDETSQMVTLFTQTLPGPGVELLAAASGLSTAEAHQAISHHLGVCFDTCHQAVLFENIAESLMTLHEHAVPIAKVQISAAPVARLDLAGRHALAEFSDPVYLHQTAIREPTGRLHRFADLPLALAAAEALPETSELRTHFHIPLSIDGFGVLRSTRSEMTPGFFRLIAQGITPHIELETYTFTVLPAELRARGVVVSVAAELEWFRTAAGQQQGR